MRNIPFGESFDPCRNNADLSNPYLPNMYFHDLDPISFGGTQTLSTIHGFEPSCEFHIGRVCHVLQGQDLDNEINI